MSSRAWWWTATAALVLAGTAGQVLAWVRDRAFWGDELYIAINLRSMSYGELTGPLAYSQAAPVGWLFGEKFVYETLGGGERILRAPSLVAGIVTLVLMAAVARRAIGRAGALVAVALTAMSPGLLYYAAELKQYAVEAAAALAVLLVGDVLVTSTGRRWWRIAAFVAVTVLAVSISFSALLVLGGVVAGLVVQRAVATQRWRDVAVVVAGAAPALAFGGFLAVRRLDQPLVPNHYDLFRTGFPPADAGPVQLASWLPRMWSGFVEWPLGWAVPALVLLAVVGGLVALAVRGRWTWFAMLVGIWAAALAGAATRQFPLEDRLAAYLLGPTLLTLAAAIDGVVRLALRRDIAARVVAVVAAVAVVVAFAPAAHASYTQATHPRYRDAGGDILTEVAARLRPGDVVLMYVFSRPLGAWYGPRYKLPIVGHADLFPDDDCQPSSVDAALAGAKRVWYVHGAKYSGHPAGFHERVVAMLSTRGRVVDARPQPAEGGASWVLIDLTAPPQPLPAPDLGPQFSCLRVR